MKIKFECFVYEKSDNTPHRIDPSKTTVNEISRVDDALN